MKSSQLELPFGNDEQDEALTTSVESQSLDDNAAAYRYEYAKSHEEQQREARQNRRNRELTSAARRSNAYYELSGNMHEERTVKEQLEEYLDEDGIDFIDLFERLDILNSLNAAQIVKMTKKDQLALALHMENKIAILLNRARLMTTDGGYEDPHFKHLYNFSSQEDANRYSAKLVSMVEIIRQTSGYQEMQKQLAAKFDGSKKALENALRNEHRKYGSYLYVTNDTERNKLHIHYESHAHVNRAS